MKWHPAESGVHASYIYISKSRMRAGRLIIRDTILRALVVAEIAQQAAAQVADGVVIIDIPDAGGTVGAAREDVMTIGCEGHSIDRASVSGEATYFGSGLDIPE